MYTNVCSYVIISYVAEIVVVDEIYMYEHTYKQ